ncbi:Transketolase-like protein 1 [Chionoecetes opilio]|uniref:Transketolase-like protein 1 n=1 Tax=Chionoecetes opilio TaxID=41210 RepID=A0A8J8WFE4_CHIOP|nr:Transketolase-like protein 1 [Chionoecetes opilio]
MMAKSSNRTTRAHKLTVEALWQIMWPHFLAWAQDQGVGEQELQRLSEEVAQSLDGLGDREQTSNPSELLGKLEEAVKDAHLLELLEQYDKTLSPTDVLVLLTHFTGQLSGELWMRTGTRQERRYVAVHDIQLTPTMQRNILVYHAVTGCDTVSQPSGHGKKTTWKVFQQHGALFDDLGRGTLSESTIRSVEEFFCRIYSPALDETNINDVRYRIFQKGTKNQEKLPPSRKCLEQHTKRAHHQAQVWFQADVPIPEIVAHWKWMVRGCYEETTPTRGIGEAVMSAVAMEKNIVVRSLAVTGVPRSGKCDELLEMFGISAGAVVKAAKEIIQV